MRHNSTRSDIEQKPAASDISRLRSFLDADLKRLPFVRGCFIEPVAIKNIQQDIKLLGGMAGAW